MLQPAEMSQGQGPAGASTQPFDGYCTFPRLSAHNKHALQELSETHRCEEVNRLKEAPQLVSSSKQRTIDRPETISKNAHVLRQWQTIHLSIAAISGT